MSNTQEFCHHILTLMLFQTGPRVFLLLYTKEDILKEVGNQTVDGSILWEKDSIEVNGYQLTVCYQHSTLKIRVCKR